MPAESELNTKVALLEQNVDSLSGLFGRLDDAIDKMGEVSNSINQLLAVHE